MERKKYRILILMVLVQTLIVFTALSGNNHLEEYRCFFTESFIKGSVLEWPAKISEMEGAGVRDFSWNFESLKARYGLIGQLLSGGKKQDAKKWLDETEMILDKMMEIHPGESGLHSIKAGITGYKIGLAFYKAPFYGPENERNLDMALSLNPEDPHVWFEKGNSAYHRPKAFGGDKEEALKYFNQSAAFFEKEKSCSWQKFLAYVMVYNCLTDLGRMDEAMELKRELVERTGGLTWLGNNQQIRGI